MTGPRELLHPEESRLALYFSMKTEVSCSKVSIGSAQLCVSPEILRVIRDRWRITTVSNVTEPSRASNRRGDSLWTPSILKLKAAATRG
jgi:hypothetical protein